MTYEEFLEALRGHDTIVFRMTGVGEKEYNTIFLVDIAKAVRKQIPQRQYTKAIHLRTSFYAQNVDTIWMDMNSRIALRVVKRLIGGSQ